MKKLLMLVSILAIGPAAGAGVSLVDLGGGSFGIEGPAGANYTWYLGVSDYLQARDVVFTDRVRSSLSSLTYLGCMDWHSVGHPEVLADTWAVAVASTPTEKTYAGIHVTGETLAVGFVDWDMGMGGIFLLNPDTGDLDALFLPEPLTLGLLGVGALLLRRRQ